ncbi:hypothetical protein HAX54_051366, partial [Datura stramonium]|nr:hypothetical protein [Datura stramonium]
EEEAQLADIARRDDAAILAVSLAERNGQNPSRHHGPNAKFDVTSIMMQFLSMKVLFNGLYGEVLNQHLINFTGIYNAYRFQGVTQEAI